MRFCVYARMHIEASTEISASNLEEAIQKARDLKTGDFVEFNGDHLDSEISIRGVNSADYKKLKA